MVRYVSIILLLVAATTPIACAQHLPALDSLLRAEVDSEHVAGAVIQVKQGDEVLHRGAYGHAQLFEFGGEPLDPPDTMTTRHLFDLASLTKVLGTTFAVMLLVDGGHVDLDAPVRTYLPAFSGRAKGGERGRVDGGEKDRVTVRHLLTHTGGLTQWAPLFYHASAAAETYAHIAQLPLEFEVGQARHYSDLGFMLLAYLVEHVSGDGLDVFLRQHLFKPLGLERTTFNPLDHGFDADDIAATSHGNPFERRMVYDDEFGYDADVDPASWDEWRRYTLRGEVNDGNAFHAHDGVAGHAGLFSTVDDIQMLLDLLRNGGRHGDDRLISEDVVRTFLTPDHTGNGLGWAMDPAAIPAGDVPEGTFGHTGFTGTNVVVVPEHDLSIVLLTNRQNVDQDGNYYNLDPTRRRVLDIVLDQIQH